MDIVDDTSENQTEDQEESEHPELDERYN